METARVLTLGDLRNRRQEILQTASRYGAQNVRVFGSVARGDATASSDLDILVDIDAEGMGFDYFGRLADLRRALRAIVGREVDVVDGAGLRRLRERVLHEAVPL